MIDFINFFYLFKVSIETIIVGLQKVRAMLIITLSSPDVGRLLVTGQVTAVP